MTTTPQRPFVAAPAPLAQIRPTASPWAATFDPGRSAPALISGLAVTQLEPAQFAATTSRSRVTTTREATAPRPATPRVRATQTSRRNAGEAAADLTLPLDLPAAPAPTAGEPTTPATTAPTEHLEPPASAFGAPRPRRRRPEPLVRCANVLPDGSGRLGALSYLVPEGLVVRPGDAVRVPFGRREVHGLVVGAGDPAKATREILEVFGVRSDPSDLALANTVAKYHFVEPQAVWARMSPASGRGADPLPAAPIRLAPDAAELRVPREVAASRRALLVRAPAVDPALLAAKVAADMAANGGQVLILCPTSTLVTRVNAAFASGSARLDARAPRGAWKGFCEGTVAVGVGTRGAALYAADHLVGIVVVDEEHPGHLEQTQPATHARDLASARTRALRIPLRLISMVPTPQALGAVSDVVHVGLRSDWPRMVLVDRTELDPRDRLVPARLKHALNNYTERGCTPVVLAPSTQAVRRCVRCGTPRPCAECTSSLCRHPETSPCATCEATDGVRMTGWDKDRLVELFGGRAKVVSLAELAGAKNAGAVVLFDVDNLMQAADLIPGRFAASIITQAAQVAGRDGLVVALGDNVAHPILADLFGPRDLIRVGRRLHAAAKSAGLPPFGRLVTVRVTRKHPPKVAGWPGQVHGPRQVGAKDWEILVRISTDKLADLAPHVLRLRRGGKARVRVE